MPDVAIRKARPADVPAIHDLIEAAAETVPVIRRSHFELYSMLRDFVVCDDDAGVGGCCALHVTWHDLAEVKSLVVGESLRGRGVGTRLVEACVDEARQIGIARVFALTDSPGFFDRLGFAEIEKHELPHKIWGECVRCSKFPDCDETAVMLDTGVPAATSPDMPRLT